jgi:type II secretory ATPase GspE/PulE/Tfp pilus assembly ATPase PilB-like protein
MRGERVPMQFLPFESGPYLSFEDAVQAIHDRKLPPDFIKKLAILERFEIYPITTRRVESTAANGEKKVRERVVLIMRSHQRGSRELINAGTLAMELKDTYLKVLQTQQPTLRLDRFDILLVDHQKFDDLRRAVTDAAFRDKILGRLDPEASAAKALEQLFRTGVAEGASDIHIQTLESGDSRVRYRINGVLQERFTLPEKTARPLVAQLKVRGQMKLEEHRLPLDGRIFFTEADIKAEPLLRGWSVRVSIVPGQEGPTAVMRLLKSAAESDFQLERLGLAPHIMTGIDNVLQSPNGIILVTGPTGSGKTSTLYSIIKKLDDGETNILTAEDPVEVQLSGITQVQVHRAIDLTFPTILRSFLRQDPDVILVGEIRDIETAEIAVQAALTGHLVLATVHTNDSFGTLQRLRSLGVDNSKLQDTIRAVLSQRLVRRLCCDCKERYDASGDLNRILGQNRDGTEPFTSPVNLYRPSGKLPSGASCKPCKGTGFDGRFPVAELWVPGITEKDMIISDAARAESLYQSALSRGMVPMLQSAMEEIRTGRTSLGECLSRTFSVDELRTRREAVIDILRKT